MTEPRLLQNFSGGRAIIVTDQPASVDVLTATLVRLGVATDPADTVETPAAIDAATLQPDRDVIFVDGDIIEGVVLPVSAIGRLPPAPIIGLLGVSAPSRLKALMRAGATSFIRKPIHGAAVYPALFVGINEYRRRRYLEILLDDQERRRRGRRDVVKAIIRTMSVHGMDDDEAYDLLRRQSMKTRQTMEDLCKDLLRSPDGQEHGDSAPREKLAKKLAT
jgi:AmiR/NasT family two-component response regulator